MGNRTYVKVLTARDRELLAWTGRCGLASAVQLARRFWLGACEQTARDRLQQLARSGYLAADHYRHGRASLLVYSLTKKGRDLFSPSQRERLFVGLPDAGALRQQLLAQEVRLRLELDAQAQGDQVLDWQTERELRAEASREQRQDPRSRDTRAASIEIADARIVIQRADGGIDEIDIEIDGQYYGQMLRTKAGKLGAGRRPVIWACEPSRVATVTQATASQPNIRVLPLC